jgi:hypothetical protein
MQTGPNIDLTPLEKMISPRKFQTYVIYLKMEPNEDAKMQLFYGCLNGLQSNIVFFLLGFFEVNWFNRGELNVIIGPVYLRG